MSGSLLPRLAGIDKRVLLAGMCVLVALIGFESWMLVLRAPLAELNTLAKTHATLKAAARNTGIGAEIERLVAETDANGRALAAASPARSDDDTVLALIDTLGRLAVAREVALGSVKVGRRVTVAGVEEQSYEIETRGDYRALHAWLGDARREAAPLVVGEFALRSIDEGRRGAMTLRFVAYRMGAAVRTAS